jgi:predicted ABC-type ATPase
MDFGVSRTDVDSQGGHDVATEKLLTRYPRTLANREAALREPPHVPDFDNNDIDFLILILLLIMID